jgi:hypothetical protein
MEHQDARLAYEIAVGARISDRSWYDVRRLMGRHKLEVTIENSQFLAQLRKEIPRSAIGVSGILDCYQKASKILESSQSLKGSKILEILAQYGVSPHQTTISRWFVDLGGYRKDREYSANKLKPLLTKAFIYKAFHQSALPQGVNHG